MSVQHEFVVDERHRPLGPSEVDYSTLFSVKGQRIVVLGAGAGLGEQISRALAAAGAELMCVDINEEGTKRVAETVGGAAYVANLFEQSSVTELAEAVRAWGPIDGFADVVGQTRPKALREFTLEDWEADFQVNLKHAFLSAQALMPLVRRGGSVVFISTAWSQYACAGAPGYGPAKAALNLWMKQLAAEYGPDGVRVNAIAPGLFLSPRFVNNFAQGNETMLDTLASKPLLQRLGQPHEIGGAAAFLFTPAAGFISGTILNVDGGATTRDPLGFADL